MVCSFRAPASFLVARQSQARDFASDDPEATPGGQLPAARSRAEAAPRAARAAGTAGDGAPLQRSRHRGMETVPKRMTRQCLDPMEKKTNQTEARNGRRPAGPSERERTSPNSPGQAT